MADVGCGKGIPVRTIAPVVMRIFGQLLNLLVPICPMFTALSRKEVAVTK